MTLEVVIISLYVSNICVSIQLIIQLQAWEDNSYGYQPCFGHHQCGKRCATHCMNTINYGVTFVLQYTCTCDNCVFFHSNELHIYCQKSPLITCKLKENCWKVCVMQTRLSTTNRVVISQLSLQIFYLISQTLSFLLIRQESLTLGLYLLYLFVHLLTFWLQLIYLWPKIGIVKTLWCREENFLAIICASCGWRHCQQKPFQQMHWLLRKSIHQRNPFSFLQHYTVNI